MPLNNFFKFILTFGMLCNVAIAASWVPIKDSSLYGLVIDSQSINTYPGLVIFNSRYGANGDNSLFFYNKAAYLCGSSEVWGVASKIETEKSLNDLLLVPEVSDAGIKEYLTKPPVVNYVKQFCNSRLSKKSIEIPVAYSDKDVHFFLPKETTFNGRKVYAWFKSFSYKTTPYLSNGEPLIIKGETVMDKVIQKDGSYEVVGYEYDCPAKTARITAFTKYSGKNVESSYSDLSKITKPERVIPESIGQGMMEFACSLK